MSITERLYLLSSPVIFNLEINGKKIEATFLSGSYLDGMGYRLHMLFSDGHSDSYEFTDCFVYNAAGKIDCYCEALKNEAYSPLSEWRPGNSVTVFIHSINNKSTDVWVIQHHEKETEKMYYTIYCQNQFQFRLEKQLVGWHPKPYQGATIDADLLKVIKSAIRYQLQEAE